MSLVPNDEADRLLCQSREVDHILPVALARNVESDVSKRHDPVADWH